MKLTQEQIRLIADRLDAIVGNNFHDAILTETDLEIEDSDVYEIKKELALSYLEEYTNFQKQ